MKIIPRNSRAGIRNIYLYGDDKNTVVGPSAPPIIPTEHASCPIPNTAEHKGKRNKAT